MTHVDHCGMANLAGHPIADDFRLGSELVIYIGALPRESSYLVSSATGNSLRIMIGGTVAGAGNLIAFNGAHGVRVLNGIGTGILSNSIYANGLLGIDLDPAGITPNDNGDGDMGPNKLQNFPVLTSASTTNGE